MLTSTAKSPCFLLLGQPRLEEGQEKLPLNNSLFLCIYLLVKRDWVSRDELAKLFWSEDPNLANSNLRSLIYKTQKRSWAKQFERNDKALRFNADSDLHLFQSAIEKQAWKEAVEVYQGSFLEDIDTGVIEYDKWLELERSQLADNWRLAALNFVAQLQSQRAFEETSALFKKLLDHNAWDEEALQLYAFQLHSSSNRYQALQVIEDFKQNLLKDLGTKVSTRSELLFEALRDHEKLSWHDFLSLVEPEWYIKQTSVKLQTRTLNTNVFEAETSFIGRQAELVQLQTSLAADKTRMLSLVGLGGTGKTRLSKELALSLSNQFKDGIYFVDLVPVHDPKLIPNSIAESLKLESVGSAPMSEQLLRFLKDKDLLLILDNFEHLLEGASFCNELIAASEKIKILVTSREALNLSLEWQYPLSGLKHVDLDVDSDAVTLFVDRAKRSRLDFRLREENQNDVIEICQLVSGMPLAIELLTTWLPLLSPQALKEELVKNLDLFESDAAFIKERHHSMRAVLETSWQLLTDKEQTVLIRLAIFPASFDKEAALALSEGNLLDLLKLGKKSFLQMQANNRYYLLVPVRQFLLNKLSQEEKLCLKQSFASYYAHYLLKISEAHRSKAFNSWLDLIEIDIDNYSHILQEFKDQAIALEIAVTIGEYWVSRSLLHEGTRLFKLLLEVADQKQNSIELAWLYLFLAKFANDFKGVFYVEKSLAICEEFNDPVLKLETYATAAGIYTLVEQVPKAQHYLAASFALSQESEPEAFQVAYLQSVYCLFFYLTHQLDMLEFLLLQADDFSETPLPDQDLAGFYSFKAEIAKAKGSFADAELFYQQSVDAQSKAGHSAFTPSIIGRFALFLLERGQLDRAKQLIHESLSISKAQNYVDPVFAVSDLSRGIIFFQEIYELDQARTYLDICFPFVKNFEHKSNRLLFIMLWLRQTIFEENFDLALQLEGFIMVYREQIEHLVAFCDFYELEAGLPEFKDKARATLTTEIVNQLLEEGQALSWFKVINMLESFAS